QPDLKHRPASGHATRQSGRQCPAGVKHKQVAGPEVVPDLTEPGVFDCVSVAINDHQSHAVPRKPPPFRWFASLKFLRESECERGDHDAPPLTATSSKPWPHPGSWARNR